MKNSTLIAVALLVTTIALAQKIQAKKVPTAVKIAFQKNYPQIKAIKWDKEDDNFEASYELDDIDNSILFDKQGNILESEIEIKTTQLPQGVLEYVKTNYKTLTVDEVAKITHNNGAVVYEVEMKKMDLLFDSNGKFIKEIKN